MSSEHVNPNMPSKILQNIKMEICHHQADCIFNLMFDLVICKHSIECGVIHDTNMFLLTVIIVQHKPLLL